MARRTRREQPAHPGLVLLGTLGVVGLTTAAVFGAAKLTARVEAIATIPGAMVPVLVLVAVVGTIAGLPFVGPVVFRLATGRAPDEQPGGLVPPLPRRLREPRRRASLVSGRRARKDVRS